MFEFNDANTFWLNVTNMVLGLVTLICCAVVGRALYQEIRVRLKHRALATDDHAFLVPELGLTMADGGERLDKEKSETPAADEPNIVRSEN